MRIHGFVDGGACGRIRIELPFDALRDLGHHETTYSHGWEAGRENAEASEIIVGERFDRIESMPIWRRLARNHKLVYEIDDDIWNVDSLNLQAIRLRQSSVQDAVATMVSMSDMVTTTTEPLAEILRQFNSNVAILPNCITDDALKIERTHRKRLVVGWAGGSSHMRDLAVIYKPLRRFFHQNPEVEFHNVGADFRWLLKCGGRFSDWETDLLSYYRNIDFDIGLIPLDDIRFNRSKSPIKAIEYMALGIPVIASAMEPYRDIVKHGVTGFLVYQRHEWMRYLRELTHDGDLRRRMGEAARIAAQEFAITKAWPRWEAAYASLLSRKTAAVGGQR